MTVTTGDMQSVGTRGEFVTDAVGADNTPPAAPTLSLASRTTTTANFNLTVPADADYDHCDLYYQAEGDDTPTQLTPFTGALPALTAGVKYSAVAFAYDTSGNRSGPSKIVEFITQRALGGTYNYTVEFKVDEAASWTVSQQQNITTDRSRTAVKLRGERGQWRIRMTEVDQDCIFIGYRLAGHVLGRRAD